MRSSPTLAESVPGELLVEDFPRLRRVIVDADDPYPGCLRLRDVLEDGDAPEWAAALADAAASVGPDDPFTILYTSGTTSFPKGAVITHHNCLPHGWWCGEVMRLTADDRVLHALPLSGTWGGLCIPLAALTHGAALILTETFEPAVALRLMETERVTVWNGVDAMAIPMLEHPTWRGAIARTCAPAASRPPAAACRASSRRWWSGSACARPSSPTA